MRLSVPLLRLIIFVLLFANLGGLWWKNLQVDRVDASFPLKAESQTDWKIPRKVASSLQQQPNISIFYNVYIPPSNVSNALRIIEEQLDMRRNSFLKYAPLFYSQIGATHVDLPCDAPCTRLHNTPEANEALTLQSLYEHCLNINHTDEWVVYLHDKGSYTPSESNERLRRTLTKAIFSDECTRQLLSKQTGANSTNECDICAARFIGFPYAHNPGNMFVAKCTYVQQLIPPAEFTERKAALSRKIHAEDEEFSKGFHLKRAQKKQIDNEQFMGTGRYAMESWIAGLPSLRPCEVVPPSSWNGMYVDAPSDHQEWVPSLHAAPQVRFDWTLRKFHGWFRLKGRLYEYRELYGQEPPSLSWVWDYYNESIKPRKDKDTISY